MTAVEELSLLGLFARLDEIERLKGITRREDGDEAILSSEGAVKKAIASMLESAESGLLPAEKTRAKAFLDAQVKSVDPNAKSAAARREKLSELSKKVDSAPGRDEPDHVKKAKDALKKAKQASKEITETHEKWARGKLMFKTNDELKAMQQKFEDTQKCLEATQLYIEEMTLLKRDTGPGPPRLPAASSNVSAPRAKAKSTASRDPTVHTAGPMSRSSGYPGPKQPPNIAALRQAEISAELRACAEADAQMLAPKAPKPSRAPKVEEEPQVVLSYSCTCKAVAEVVGITVNAARDMAESSNDFKRHLSHDDWEAVKARSVAIEKEQKMQEREKEQRKSEKAVARITDQQAPSYAKSDYVVAPASKGKAPSVAVGKAAPKAKPPPKVAVAPKKAPLKGLAGANRFGGFESDDDDDGDGWTTVGR